MILAVGAALAVLGVVFFVLGTRSRAVAEKARALAEVEAKKTLDEARLRAEAEVRRAEATAQKAELEGKERVLRAREEAEQESARRRAELTELEKRILQKEESLDKKLTTVEKRVLENENRAVNLEKRERRVGELEVEAQKKADELVAAQRAKLEEIAGLTAEQAKKDLIRDLENEARLEATRIVRRIEEEAADNALQKARRHLAMAIQRMASEYVVENTVSVLDLPSDDVKGRIIGREGRNIRAIESATGVDIIVDDTPEAVLLSSFDPIRREVARRALERLIQDGRIHPARIEEVVEKVRSELWQHIQEAGKGAAEALEIPDLHPEVVKLLGRLKFRTSYGQNVLQHSLEVAWASCHLASELKADVAVAKRAGLLHDIGKAIDREQEGTHLELGRQILKKFGESEAVIHGMECHHGDYEPRTVEAVIVNAADAISAARPGARREILETYVKRLEKLEKMTEGMKGIEKTFAIQAGRELRVIVDARQVTDDETYWMSKDLAKRIESELQYPGQIRITVIRETRAVEYAK
ncbi:ribonuclease Y [Acidobacteria bacterium ACD]|nr:MAG: ribonuclease Y [Acidobacteriota bacterium]MCE7958152.1 ribonuclease Y [Acidobacteria bacterium ACB2]MDL1949374.1 ribonuclease Y [Acidobacteria bacterium ACD]